ncbi:hypothetical protein F2P81_010921 [Scophthalmus maximus]|uniref:Teneurin N-terminal domain-containing protein n=1 Tax=Scophthalmus maximus TaxID=52904 RepID=A0A6A4SWX1_SCOMX|nr:hypothetical protein F2P81_010921 [Scophthalmus maximus]
MYRTVWRSREEVCDGSRGLKCQCGGRAADGPAAKKERTCGTDEGSGPVQERVTFLSNYLAAQGDMKNHSEYVMKELFICGKLSLFPFEFALGVFSAPSLHLSSSLTPSCFPQQRDVGEWRRGRKCERRAAAFGVLGTRAKENRRRGLSDEVLAVRNLSYQTTSPDGLKTLMVSAEMRDMFHHSVLNSVFSTVGWRLKDVLQCTVFCSRWSSPMPSPSCPPSVCDQSHPHSPHDNLLLADAAEADSEEEEEEEEEEQEEEEHAARLCSPVSHEQQSNHHGSALPPVPPPHRQQPSVTALNQSLGSTHHAGQSLNSTRQLTTPSGSPAPVAGQSPAELQTTPPESVPLQDSWVLGSNVPLETSSVMKTFHNTQSQLTSKCQQLLD